MVLWSYVFFGRPFRLCNIGVLLCIVCLLRTFICVSYKIKAVDMDKRNLAFHLTTDVVALKYQSISDNARFLRLCVIEEIMGTVEYYRDGSMLSVVV